MDHPGIKCAMDHCFVHEKKCYEWLDTCTAKIYGFLLDRIKKCCCTGEKSIANGACVRAHVCYKRYVCAYQKVLRMVRVCVLKNVANGTCVRVHQKIWITVNPTSRATFLTGRYGRLMPVLFKCKQKSGNTWILLNTDQDRVQNFEV